MTSIDEAAAATASMDAAAAATASNEDETAEAASDELNAINGGRRVGEQREAAVEVVERRLKRLGWQRDTRPARAVHLIARLLWIAACATAELIEALCRPPHEAPFNPRRRRDAIRP